MKCPHCNQDHPDGTIFCPLTGNRIQMSSCQNPRCINYGKFNLPLDSKFCPDCGKPLLKEHAGIRKFICSVCGYIMESAHGIIVQCPVCRAPSNKISELKEEPIAPVVESKSPMGPNFTPQVNDSFELHKFFPIAGIILGKTTIEEIKRNSDLYDGIIYSPERRDGKFIFKPTIHVKYKNMSFVSDDALKIIESVMFSSSFGSSITFPDKWKKLGFDERLSPKEWICLFEEMNYYVYYDELEMETESFYCNINAFSPDDSISFTLSFIYEKNESRDIWVANKLDGVYCVLP